MKIISTFLKLGLGFAGGYIIAKTPKETMRPALKKVVKAGAAVQSTVKKAVSTAAEEVEDILAEIRAEEASRGQEAQSTGAEPPAADSIPRSRGNRTRTQAGDGVETHSEQAGGMNSQVIV